MRARGNQRRAAEQWDLLAPCLTAPSEAGLRARGFDDGGDGDEVVTVIWNEKKVMLTMNGR